MSPPKWHVGHVSWIYEAIMSKLDKNYEFYSKEFSESLNSYYQQFGTPHDKGLRGVVSRPTVDEVFAYFNTLNQRVETFINSHELTVEENRLITIGFHHECQHQELMVYDFQHLLAEAYKPAIQNKIKTRLILDVFKRFQNTMEYFPIDISDILAESSETLLSDYDNLHITGIVDTYEGGLEFLKRYDTKKNLIIFLGSSFGNFAPDDGVQFLKKINSVMKPGDLFLIGLDLVKDSSILESAYNDSAGVTARFNLNVLSRINDELDADFDLDAFTHYSVYNESKQRIEMYLKSLVNQTIVLSKSGVSVYLRKDELIHTEYSHKFKLSQLDLLFEGAGFTVNRTWCDEKKYFSLTLLSKN